MSTNKDRSKAYGEAVTDLKDAYPEAWVGFYSERLRQRGLEYKVRLTAKERAARAQGEALVRDHQKILALAEKHGLHVTFTGPPETSGE